MSDIALEQKIKAGGFLPLTLTLDPLQAILLELMKMLKDHDGRIINLENSKADKNDLTIIQNNIDANKKETDARIAELEKMFKDKNAALQEQLNSIKAKADEAFNGMNQAKDRLDGLQGNVDKLTNQVNDLQELMDGQRSQVSKLKDDLGDLQSRVDMMNGKVLTMDGKMSNLNNDLGNLKKEVENLKNQNNNGDDGSAKVETREFIANPDNEKAISDLTNRINDLENKLIAMSLQKGEPVSSSKSDGNSNLDLSKFATNDALSKLDGKVADNYRDLKDQIDALKKKLDSVKSPEPTEQTNWRPRRDLTPVERKPKTEESEFPVRPPQATGNFVTKPEFEELAEKVAKLQEQTTENTAQINNNKASIDKHDESIKSHEKTLDDHEKRIKALEDKLKEMQELADKLGLIDDLSNEVKRLQGEIEQRPTKDLIERLFEKFKQSMGQIADMIKQQKSDNGDGQYATKEDLNRIESLVKSFSVEFEEAAAARKCTKCLSCGRGYREVSGALPDKESAQILGAAPISAVMDGVNKPCFVYGTDKELYYAANPRGKSFVVRGSTPPKSARN
ncbi:hypothetical protein TVAG_365900 [Trichomonas vaginalis G3]|uniref:Uncharacterized protein n=1 Tax=Trichomonas vaginalis (strain ATCC PRA-98 / G3) TaxID=412133 RepID=A2DHN4_TRIV3|nr:hypothetical protein TVAGG3_0302900 [Trichomonas vaginalis G3]EAY20082.1 hypothetical protein TVAG_365900 [Trichomonas vaginalis G3]KAI5528035.1 hypothetical protein TVAGG3_0302900 [Trichomonas vaginalis G3]|eukprot:XP_001581068.1 hypothetical protein [Trichomonas vaginalis G3]